MCVFRNRSCGWASFVVGWPNFGVIKYTAAFMLQSTMQMWICVLCCVVVSVIQCIANRNSRVGLGRYLRTLSLASVNQPLVMSIWEVVYVENGDSGNRFTFHFVSSRRLRAIYSLAHSLTTRPDQATVHGGIVVNIWLVGRWEAPAASCFVAPPSVSRTRRVSTLRD